MDPPDVLMKTFVALTETCISSPRFFVRPRRSSLKWFLLSSCKLFCETLNATQNQSHILCVHILTAHKSDSDLIHLSTVLKYHFMLLCTSAALHLCEL